MVAIKEMKPIRVGEVKVYLVWFDSLGAKSSCILLETPDLTMLVDPGAAEMQPSFPLSKTERKRYHQVALQTIKEVSREADYIFISHYHHDHYMRLPQGEGVYEGKRLWIKEPNQWINRSQRSRARRFLQGLCELLEGVSYDQLIAPLGRVEVEEPMEGLPLAYAKDYGDYQERKEELLAQGKSWFNRIVNSWRESPWLSQFEAGRTEVRFCDGVAFSVGDTKVRFTKPLFHGIEYARMGWVIGLILEHKDTKIVYTSDLQGPIIEDYADWIIREAPDLLVLDGATTYVLGFMLKRINLQRIIVNVCAILRHIDAEVIIYDHHVARGALFKERLSEVYDTAYREGRAFLTAAEWLGREPLVLAKE